MFKNVKVKYEISYGSFGNRMQPKANAIAEWLLATDGYCILEDSYDPEYYRYAMYVGPMEITNILNKGGKATIEFNCLPQKYLKDGSNPQAIKNIQRTGSNGNTTTTVTPNKIYTFSGGMTWQYIPYNSGDTATFNVSQSSGASNSINAPKLNAMTSGIHSVSKDSNPNVELARLLGGTPNQQIRTGPKNRSGYWQYVPNSLTLINPTGFESHPIIQIVRNDVKFGDLLDKTLPLYICFSYDKNSYNEIYLMRLKDSPNGLIIDTENQSLYTYDNLGKKVSQNRLVDYVVYSPKGDDRYITPPTWPKLKKGITNISYLCTNYESLKKSNPPTISNLSSSVLDAFVEIRVTPNWWTV